MNVEINYAKSVKYLYDFHKDKLPSNIKEKFDNVFVDIFNDINSDKEKLVNMFDEYKFKYKRLGTVSLVQFLTHIQMELMMHQYTTNHTYGYEFCKYCGKIK